MLYREIRLLCYTHFSSPVPRTLSRFPSRRTDSKKKTNSIQRVVRVVSTLHLPSSPTYSPVSSTYVTYYCTTLRTTQPSYSNKRTNINYNGRLFYLIKLNQCCKRNKRSTHRLPTAFRICSFSETSSVKILNLFQQFVTFCRIKLSINANIKRTNN